MGVDVPMNKKKRPPIPINLISGPLGVGKTTTINQLLALKPENEKWAILVNELELVDVDVCTVNPAARRVCTVWSVE